MVQYITYGWPYVINPQIPFQSKGKVIYSAWGPAKTIMAAEQSHSLMQSAKWGAE